MQNWRLIPPIQAPGKTQMAIDNWLFEQHRSRLHPPTLRFYTWSPVAISLGYHQHRYPESWNHLVWQNEPVEIVQRRSGGRAVLHQGDLTYAVIASGISGSRMQAYQTICEFLIQGWNQLGIELHYGQAGRGYIHNPNCFGTATAADLVTADGVKLIGSAQFRKDETILQHGSMQLKPNTALFAEVFPQESIELADISQPIDEIINALTNAASDRFGANFSIQPLTDSEWSEIL